METNSNKTEQYLPLEACIETRSLNVYQTLVLNLYTQNIEFGDNQKTCKSVANWAILAAREILLHPAALDASLPFVTPEEPTAIDNEQENIRLRIVDNFGRLGYKPAEITALIKDLYKVERLCELDAEQRNDLVDRLDKI